MTNKRKLLFAFLIALLFAAVFKTFFIEGFIVIGDSMYPTIHSGDYVFINKLSYLKSEPERGEIIVAHARESGQRIIKRVIGLPGERFAIEEGSVVIRATRVEEGTKLEESYLTSTTTPAVGITLIKLDPKEYFALGDNRAASIDSRELGPIDIWDIEGRVWGAFNLKTFKFRLF